MLTLPRLPGIERLSADELRELVRTADALGISPRELAVVIFFESSFRTTARAPSTGAVGLIQWTPATARELGMTAETIGAMGATEQLRLIERTYRKYKPKLLQTGDFYVAVFAPSRGLGREDSAVLATVGDGAYERNAKLDLDYDGSITVRDLRVRVLDALAAYPMTVEVADVGDPAPTIEPPIAEGTLLFVGLLGALYLTWRFTRRTS